MCLALCATLHLNDFLTSHNHFQGRICYSHFYKLKIGGLESLSDSFSAAQLESGRADFQSSQAVLISTTAVYNLLVLYLYPQSAHNGLGSCLHWISPG